VLAVERVPDVAVADREKLGTVGDEGVRPVLDAVCR
jgi:hypothetical protein